MTLRSIAQPRARSKAATRAAPAPYSRAVLDIVVHPAPTLGAAARAPRLRSGVVAVAATGMVSLALDLAASLVGAGGVGAVALSVAIPLLLAGFWLVSALLVGAGARLMGDAPQRRELLAVSGLTFPVLVGYALIALVQALSLRWGGDALSTAVGLFALPVVGWFVALNVLAVRAVYQTPVLSAVAVALIPYAALTAVLLLLVIVLSLLQSVGAV